MIFGADVPELLRRLRKRAGLSQQALAQQIEVSQRSISDYETGKTDPTLTVFDRLCVSCGVGSLGELQQEIDKRMAGHANTRPGPAASLFATPAALRLMADMQERLDLLESEVRRSLPK